MSESIVLLVLSAQVEDADGGFVIVPLEPSVVIGAKCGGGWVRSSSESRDRVGLRVLGSRPGDRSRSWYEKNGMGFELYKSTNGGEKMRSSMSGV